MECSAFDQPYVPGARALLGIFRGELHTLAFPQQFEDGAAHRAAVEEVFDSTFVADEAETLVDQQPSDCAVWHTQSPPFRPLGESPKDKAGSGAAKRCHAVRMHAGRASQHQLSWNPAQSRQFEGRKSSGG